MKNILVFTLIVVFVSCKQDKKKYQKIDFETDYLFNSEIESKIQSDSMKNSHFGDGFKYQIGAADYATKGNYKNALVTWDLAMGTSEKTYNQSQIDSINKRYKKVNAINYITEQAKQNQVLIINEAHHSSMHRVFTKSLLQNLYKIGYKNVGFEALSIGEDKDSLLNYRKYPVQKTGYYIKDPQFGDLVRTALEIGYEVFSYEDATDSNGTEREIQQAQNIQRIIEQKPNEKFLIHCGFGHAIEGNYPAWGKAMAGRLTEFTGIDPLTIYQVYYSEKSKPEFNHPLLKALDLKESTVLIDGDGSPMKYEYGESFSDVAVLQPNTTYENGRPNWLFSNENKAINLQLNDIDISFPVMVLAYKKGEDITTAVPMDIVEIENKSDSTNLALRTGEYEIVAINLDGNARKFQLYVE
ncbi:hypothetical protein [Maribacter sp. MAR_2009_72]|uniref:hypothetical protein n=1 Tax=Maribacter sp. MAR_2009_72 TaxID=1250050 RepID=UPI00119A9680|nr:hypothetical protein [Maribacter sp. MAR_2009_72]TVZ15503.1 hypothetical protein JM81_1748 [Maribacter sp. MAR_2009_72]